MFRFFRSIRQNLFSKGKFANYSGYAIGEIALIVVGILIALQISNWNEERLERIEETNTLRQLLEEFRLNKDQLESVMALNGASMKANYQLLRLDELPLADASEETVANLLNTALSVRTFDPIRSGLTSLISSGRIVIIENDTLRTALAAWPDLVNDLRDNQLELWRKVENHFNPFGEANLPWKAILSLSGEIEQLPESSLDGLMEGVKSPRFQNMLANQAWTFEWELDEAESLLQTTNNMIKMIETELAQ